MNQRAVAMDSFLVRQAEEAIRRAGCEPHRMVSGAGHDAMILAEKVPSAMIFLRTPGGISHNPAETVERRGCGEGARERFASARSARFLTHASKESAHVHNLGGTRSSQQPNHLLLTPDTFVRAPLPGMKGCTAIVHVGPGARRGIHAVHGRVRSGRRTGRHHCAAVPLRAGGRRQGGSRRQANRTWRARLCLFARRVCRIASWPRRRAASRSSRSRISRSRR